MMNALLAALSGAMIVAGVLGIIAGLRPTPVRPPAPRRHRLAGRLKAIPPRARWLAGVGLAVGVVLAVTTGWVIAIVVIPVAAVGVPWLLAAPESAARIARLEALAEWTRSLAGVLTVGVGLEQALLATLRSTPEEIRPQVSRLVARLRDRWDTEKALRVFADELDDATGDLVAATLILGARRRGAGLSAVLQGLADTVAADVAVRRQIEADQAKPRSTARLVTLITVIVLGLLAFSGDYLAPYRTPIGQLILAVLLAAYAGALVWMKRMAAGRRVPRFLGEQAREGRP